MRPDLPCSIDNTVFYNTDFGNFEDCRFEFPEGKYRYGYRLCTASGIFPQTDAKKAHSRTDLVFSGLFFASAPHATAPAVLRIEWFLYKAGCSKVLRSPCGLTCVNCARFKGYPLPIRPIYMRDGLDPPLLTNTHSHPRIHRPTQPNARQNCAANPYDQIEHGNDCPGELPRCVAWAAARCDANSECHSFAIRTNGVDCPTSTANASSHYMLMRLGTKSTVPNHQWLAFTKPGPPGPFPPGPPPAPGPRPHPMPPGPAPSGVPVESDCAIRRLALECECGTAADHNPHPIAARHSGASVALWAGIAS